MQKIVLIVKEDICTANGKDEAAVNKLLEVMHKYGDVVSYEDYVKVEVAEMQKIIDNLKSQVTELQSVKLSDAEKGIVNAFRECKAVSDKEYESKLAERESKIDKLNKSFNAFAKQIKDCVAANTEEDK